MVQVFSRRFVVALGSAFAGSAALANAPGQSLRPRVRPKGFAKRAAPGAGALIRQAGVSGAVGFALVDVESGEILEGHQPEATLPPASVTKAVTAMYALETLGAEHRFVTRLMAHGAVSEGVLEGDLILVGGGDPTLDTDALGELAQGLKAAGIREVRGQFLVNGAVLPSIRSIDPLQPAHAGYSPAVSGLSLNFNRVHFEWTPQAEGYQVTMDARSARYRPDVSIARIAVADRSLPVYTYEAKGSQDHWTVARGALGRGGARWLPVRQPELYAGDVFRTLARAHGIVLKPAKISVAPPQGRVMAFHMSAPLTDILRGMLKYSTNLTAEMVGMAASQARGVAATTLAESAAAMSGWAREALGMPHAALVDHSGLGGASRMRPDELVRALAAVERRDVLRPILKDIRLRDAKGRIKEGARMSVQAKTGTLNFVSGLAGYVTLHSGRVLAFAILSADLEARAAVPAHDRERPKGARRWVRRARNLQQRLIERWDVLYAERG
ncbi:MAG: D-alanyl-D-alanine carboxypeptidase/D-alanyl-D-alanine-endopeptidase [Pseudopelagicola sp.]|nr:D-alanyl-D-alanine carboxypeptidase/D-alanyl-D-alanine-endopeptidase [Pseudopelagicola sp.]